MATNDTPRASSGPTDQPTASVEEQRLAAPELVEILRQLGAHHRKVYEQTYGNPPWTHEQSAAYWHHPVVWACKWLEQRLAIDRHDLEAAVFRLTTPLGLRGMAPLIAPDGEPDKEDKGQPDWLWMIPKFRELDRDGTTARLWQLLVEDYPAILADAGMLVPLGNGGGDGKQAKLALVETHESEETKAAGDKGDSHKTEKSPTVNARMMDLISRKPKCHTWSAKKFADCLNCSKSTISETTAWKSLGVYRTAERLKRAETKQKSWQAKG